ncbi:hypothetical protein HU763_014865 [Pseudomonas anuradhapurensis]|uniref:ORC-CDC6 family AAA ATPase n=1 Tax=Pseudomonas anuradhapurensis TaxID=485870 RepID=UPI0016493B85|nr:hypothetical protein [Pseudomonas anuradhapurensis]QXI46057.1 hypothetical protein HU763_014865 [Pseudomonas anuradhapurensis]
MDVVSFSELAVNPFSVKTPENLTPQEVVDLFVPYPEYGNLQLSGHQFLHGHRGSGKSMMLKMMTPDAQRITRSCSLAELPYYGAYLSIKTTEINAAEYVRIENEPSGYILSEHVLTTKILGALFFSIKSHCSELWAGKCENISEFYRSVFAKRLSYVGWDEPVNCDHSHLNVVSFVDIIDSLQAEIVRYIKRRAFSRDYIPYNGPLLGFQDVLLPVLDGLRKCELIPNCPVFLLLDDSDNLSLQQTKVLNTWVSYRSTDKVSLKISTQMNYKTFSTTSGIKIESPHDYSEINFTSVYTGSLKENYPKLVEEIVKKRLSRIGIHDIEPRSFFPVDQKQEDGIRKIAEELKTKWEASKAGGYRASDDAYRFARPEYIRRLSGKSKQGARYKYAGFDQLVHISSGIIRFFLEPAARMFADQLKANGGAAVTSISTTIQDDEIRKQCDNLLIEKFDELKGDVEDSDELRGIDKLRNLIQGLGSLFQAHLLDENASQRRMFSFVISDAPSAEIESLLGLAMRFGYLYQDTVGNKSGMGRTKLYVLSRRLAPAYKLDPVGFSGYLSLTNNFLLEISERPNAFVSRLKKKGASGFADDSPQLSLL